MINIDALNDDEKLAALESIHKSIAESKEIQKKKITTNVELIVKALKKIESDLKQRYDETGQLIANLKNGEDGRDGKDGKDGKNGRDGRDGPMGPRGYDGLPGRNGIDGADGVSITDAHIDFDGSLIISLSSGRVINVGEVVAADIAEKIKVITNGGGTSQGVLDAIASLQAQIDSIASGLVYQGTWNASTNNPALASGVGTAGYYYIVAVAGSTNLNGVTDWQVGDWALFNGTVWQKLDQTNLVTSVAGRTGAVTLTTADIGGLGTIATQAANNVSITGGSITGITDLAIADGGTGASTAAAAITALTGTQTSGYYLRSNGTSASLSAISAGDVPTLNQNTTGTAAGLSATLATTSGGTGLSSFTANRVLYTSSTSAIGQSANLTFDGTNLITTQAVSIGTGSTPGARLDIGGQDGTNVFIRSTGTSSARLRAYVNSAESAVIGFLNGGGQFFEVAGTEQMRLTSTGLGIGTSSPAAKLHIGGNTASTQQAIFTTGVTDSDFKVVARNGVSGATAIQGYIGLDYANGTWPLLAGVQFIRNSTSGELAFTAGTTTSASEQMRLTSTGLGIGTTLGGVNSFRLAVLNNIGLIPTTQNTVGSIVSLASALGASSNEIFISNEITGYVNAGNYATALRFYTRSTTAATERIRIDSAGNLGIGTSSPQARLEVGGAGQLFINQDQRLQWNIAGSTTIRADIRGTSGNAIVFGNRVGGTLTDTMTLDGSGNLGLGVTPSAWTSGARVLQFPNTGSIGTEANGYLTSIVNARESSSNAWSYLLTGAGASKFKIDYGSFAWYTAPSGTAGNAITFTQAMTLDASGNFMVGGTTASRKVTITDTATGGNIQGIRIVGNAGNYYDIGRVSDTGEFTVTGNQTGVPLMTWVQGGSERMRIDSSGNLLVNATSQFGGADCKLQGKNGSSAQSVSFLWNATTTGDANFVAFGTEATVTQRGSITYNRAGGLTTYNTTSDYRAKDISGPVTDSGALIDSVPVYMGKMHGATQERPMFIAHETPAYAHTGEKDAVDTDGNPVYQQMDASALIPVMWAEIQSLRKRLADAGL